MALNGPVVEVLRQMTQKKYATPTQIALAWPLAQKPLTSSYAC